MSAITQFVRTTIVGGLLFLAPIVVLIVILAKAFEYAKKGLSAALAYFPAAQEDVYAAAKKAGNPGTAHRIDDLPPGLKRLRAAENADAIRQAVLADQTRV